MKVVILAGGFGTRISEESAFKPKPMIEIGGMPILWHIMKTYSAYGYNEFVICAGYKQHVIKEWFADYFLRHGADFPVRLMECHQFRNVHVAHRVAIGQHERLIADILADTLDAPPCLGI